MTTAQPTVSVVMRAPRERERLRALLAPLLLDRATLEVLVDGSDAPGIGELGAVTDARVRPLGGDRRGERLSLEPDRRRTARAFGHACTAGRLQGVFAPALRAMRLTEPSVTKLLAATRLEGVASVNRARPGARRPLDRPSPLALRGL